MNRKIEDSTVKKICDTRATNDWKLGRKYSILTPEMSTGGRYKKNTHTHV